MMGSHDHASPAVSVITPAYNAGKYIGDTLQSALKQTFEDFEVVVVDDGSTDDTAAIAQSFASRDPRIRLIRQPNRGIGGARNVAMTQARGRVLALLDSDDTWVPSYLQEQMSILDARPEFHVVSANALNLGGPLDGTPLRPVPADGQVFEVTLLHLIQREDAVCILSVFRREILDAIGGFDEALRGSEDYDFGLRALAAGFRIGFNPRPLGWYRRRPDSVSADEILMLHAIAFPLAKVRRLCGDRPEIREAVDRQLERFARRRLVVSAKRALQRDDPTALAAHFDTLHRATGSLKYAAARWLSAHAPITILILYKCKRVWNAPMAQLRRGGLQQLERQ